MWLKYSERKVTCYDTASLKWCAIAKQLLLFLSTYFFLLFASDWIIIGWFSDQINIFKNPGTCLLKKNPMIVSPFCVCRITKWERNRLRTDKTIHEPWPSLFGVVREEVGESIQSNTTVRSLLSCHSLNVFLHFEALAIDFTVTEAVNNYTH